MALQKRSLTPHHATNASGEPALVREHDMVTGPNVRLTAALPLCCIPPIFAQFSMQGKDEDGDGIADRVDEDGDGVMDELYVCAAPGIDPFVARAAKTPKSTTGDCYRRVIEDEPTKDGRLHNKFMPGYGGYIPTEMNIKTSGGQWSPPKFLEVEAKEVRAWPDLPLCKRSIKEHAPHGPLPRIHMRSLTVCACRARLSGRLTFPSRILEPTHHQLQEHPRGPLSSLVVC